MPAMIVVRELTASDREAVVRFRCDLWPEGTAAEHDQEVALHLAGAPRSTLPVTVLVAVDDGEPVGFVEAGLRSHADGCDGRHAVGFIEGWYVAPSHRRQGVGRALVAAAEAWALAQGCSEMASDTWADDRGRDSVAAHRALGYDETDRVVTFRKALV